MEKSSMVKWKGKASTALKKTSADKIWPFFADYFNMHKWYPNMATCFGIHGVNGEVGCIRYVAGFSFGDDDGGVGQGNWAKSRLVAIDPNEMSLSYEILECSYGFNNYLGNYKVIPGGPEGCVVEWSFTVDPVEGLTCEYVVQKYQDILNQWTKKMEDALLEKNDL